MQTVIDLSGSKPEKVSGAVIEDRGSQITFSALGQQAPLEAKRQWDPDFAKRQVIKARLEKLIPGFMVRLGGTTSLQVRHPDETKRVTEAIIACLASEQAPDDALTLVRGNSAL